MVSIIVPVYNTEKYIDKCIQSAINQTYKDIEIILIDDGSTDNSSKKCDSYTKTDKKIKVIHKKNGGLSDARNIGIKESKGDYFVFLDSDDYLPADCIEKGMNQMIKEKAEIVIMKMCYISENGNNEIENKEKIYIKKFNSKRAIENSLYQKLFNNSVSSKIYKKELFNNIKFPVGRLSEDLAISYLVLNNAKNIVYLNEIGYYYRQQKSSIMHTFNPRRLDALEWTKEIEEFCKNNYPELLNAAKCRTFNVAVHLLLDLPNERKCKKKML